MGASIGHETNNRNNWAHQQQILHKKSLMNEINDYYIYKWSKHKESSRQVTTTNLKLMIRSFPIKNFWKRKMFDHHLLNLNHQKISLRKYQHIMKPNYHILSQNKSNKMKIKDLIITNYHLKNSLSNPSRMKKSLRSTNYYNKLMKWKIMEKYHSTNYQQNNPTNLKIKNINHLPQFLFKLNTP